MDGASGGLEAVDLTENEKKSMGPNLRVDRKFRNVSSVFKSCRKILFKPCIFLPQILTENKVKS